MLEGISLSRVSIVSDSKVEGLEVLFRSAVCYVNIKNTNYYIGNASYL